MIKKFRILLVYPNIPMMLVPPLSVAIFTWILRQEGFEVELFDTTSYCDKEGVSPKNRVKYLQYRNVFTEKNLELSDETKMFEDFRENLRSFKPDLLIYSFTEDALSRALQLLRISNPFGIPTIVGGVLATADPEWLISFPEITMLGVGEGEEVVRELALRLSRHEDISNIPNIWIKLPKGKILRNPIRPYVNLDSYSTDFSLFDEARFERPQGGKIFRSLPIETYRGCPHNCSYCNSPMYTAIAKKYNRTYLRRRSIKIIRREIRYLVDNYRLNHLYFVDDSFLARPKREIEEFIEMYKEFSLPFWFNTRPEHCSLDILKRLKDVGLFRVSFGIESGNEEFRKKYLNRPVSNKKLLQYFDIINKSGITYSINYMIGFPSETREMVFETIGLAKKINGYDALTISIFTPYRGTQLRQEAIKSGWLDPNLMTVHTTASSMLTMPQFTSRQIDGLMNTFPLYVKFDESAWQEIEKAERFKPEGEEILERYSKMYRELQWGEKRS